MKKERTGDEQRQLILLAQQVGQDIHDVASVIGHAAERYHGEQGAIAFLMGMTTNFLSVLFGCKIKEGTPEERREKAIKFFTELINNTNVTAYDIPDNGTETD